MRTRTALILTVLLAASGCSEKRATLPSTSPSPSLSTQASPTPDESPARAVSARLIAHMTKNYDGIAIFDVAAGTDRILLKSERVSEPKFETASLLSYVETAHEAPQVRNLFREVSISGGVPRTLFESTVGITAYAWSPKRTAVAFIGADDDGYGFYVWNRGGKVVRERRFVSQLGRDGVDLDEQRIEWSPDGERVLVVVTAAGAPGDSQPTLFVIREGKDVVSARVGTLGRWLANGIDVLYEDFRSSYAWHIVDTKSGDVRDARAVSASARADISPDRTRIAYDRGGDDQTIHVFSVIDGTDKIVAREGVSPVWLSNEAIAFSNAEACTNASECGPDRWKLTGKVTKLILDGGAAPMRLLSTFGLDILYA